MHYNTTLNNHGLASDPFKACVGPRPIAWVSTISKDGRDNLAPFSQFNNLSFDPPMVMISMQHGGGVSASARQSSCDRYALLYIDKDLSGLDGACGAFIPRHQLRGLIGKVLPSGRKIIAVRSDLYVKRTASLQRRILYCHIVMKRKLLHDHIDRVESIISARSDVYRQIDFRKRTDNYFLPPFFFLFFPSSFFSDFFLL